MDIRIDKDFKEESNNPFEAYAKERLRKYFDNYPFLNTVQIYLRGQKHPYKKVKLQVRVKGKEIFTEAPGAQHHDAFDSALQKLRSQLEKYKTKRYTAA